MATGSGQKSNIIVYSIVGLLILVFLGFGCKDKTKKTAQSNQVKTEEKKEDKQQIANIIDEKINEAVRKGDEDKDYVGALALLNETKSIQDPNPPTTEQNQKIDDLITTYTDLQNEPVEQARADDESKEKMADKSESQSEKSTEITTAQAEDSKVAENTTDKDTSKAGDKTTFRITPAKRKRTSYSKKKRMRRNRPRMIPVRAVIKKRRERVTKGDSDNGMADVYVAKVDKDSYMTVASDTEATTITGNELIAMNSKGDGNLFAEGKREGESDSSNKNYPKPSFDLDAKDSSEDIGMNIIDRLISQAQKLGNKKRFSPAIVKLTEAKSYTEPEPSETQNNKINTLLGKYGTALIDGQIIDAEKLCAKGKHKRALDRLNEIKIQNFPKPTEEQIQRIDELIASCKEGYNKFIDATNKKLAEEFYRKGRIELSKNNYDEALNLFGEALKLNPDHILAHSYKGTAHLRKNESEEAMKSSEEALKRDSAEPNAHFTKGEIYYGKFKDPEAEKEYDQVIAKDTENAYAYFKLGVIKLLAGQNHNGITMFDKALSITGPGALNAKYQRNAYYNKGVGQERMNQLGGAEKSYQKALALDEKYKKVYIQLGEVYYKRKSYDNATRSLREGLAVAPNDYDLNFLLGKSYDTWADKTHDNGKRETALTYYKRAIEVKPKSFEALYNIGRIQLKKKEYADAKNYFQQASNIRDNDYPLVTDYAAAHAALKEYDEGIKKYEQATAIDNERIDAYIGLGGIYFARSKKADGTRDEEDIKKAVENLENVNAKNSKLFEVNKTLGSCYFILKQYDQSAQALENAVALKKSSFEARKNLATVYFANKNFEKAAPHYKKAIELKDSDPELYLRLGESYFKTGDNDSAKEWFNKLVDKFPEYKTKRKIRIYLRAVGEDI